MPGYFAKPPSGAKVNSADRLSRGLVGAWLFNEKAGGPRDAVGVNNGTLVNAPTWGASRWGQSLTLTAGSSQAVTFADTNALAAIGAANAAFTIGVRFVFSGNTFTAYNLFGRGTNSGLSRLIRLQIDSSNRVAADLYDGSNNPSAAGGAVGGAGSVATAMLVRWNRYGTNQIRVYLNGVQVASATDTTAANALNGSTQTWYVGRRADGVGGAFFSGAVDSAFVWNRGLTPQQAAAWSADPVRMFRPRRVPVPLGVAAGGGGSPVTATPGTASLVLTGFAPAVLTPRLATPGTRSLALTAFAPVVSAPRLVTPGTRSLTVTGFAPTVSTPRTATPVTAALAITGFAPVVQTPRAVAPGAANLTLSASAPTVVLPRVVTPGTRALVVTLYAPTATVAGASNAEPPRVNLVSVVGRRTAISCVAGGRESLASVVSGREALVSA